jgi:hypothetical protein
MHFVLKIVVSALIVAGASELAKRSVAFGALLASLPLTSLLALVWLYRDTNDAARVADLSTSIFWLVIPSLLLFLVLPLLIRRGMNFYAALGAAAGFTVVAYLIMSVLMQRFGSRA